MNFFSALAAIGPHGVFSAALFSLVGSLIWLLFWIQEDYKRPEPKGLIALSFALGGLSTLAVLPIQLFAGSFLGASFAFLIVISISEELFKYLAAFWAALRKPQYDEPIDAMIYMITSAVGFVAIENALYIITSLAADGQHESIIFGLQRLVTPTVLHIVASAVIGLFLAIGFYKSKLTKRVLLFFGLLIAIILHTAFNYFILNSSNADSLAIAVWGAALLIIFLFEYVKRIHPKR